MSRNELNRNNKNKSSNVKNIPKFIRIKYYFNFSNKTLRMFLLLYRSFYYSIHISLEYIYIFF